MPEAQEEKLTPGPPVARRPLHFIWILDCSSSMDGMKIQSLNQAIKNALPEMKKVAGDNPQAQVLVRAVTFASGAQWHVSQAVPLDNFQWDRDVTASGSTAMGEALSLVAKEMRALEGSATKGYRGFPPSLVLVSDGQPTDDFQKGLQDLTGTKWGKRTVRMAIAIGADADKGILKQFVNPSEYPVLEAHNAQELDKMIRFTSTIFESVIQAKSVPTGGGAQTAGNVVLPPPPASPPSGGDVW
ncbi:VWA domain-containing protein [candidate division WOR-3 bacterium]|nr:VWA domain-containing protein [candidate division WOR-3 bacterium]